MPALTMLVAGVTLTAANQDRVSKADQAATVDSAAAEILSRARRWAGGQALEQIRSISVVASRGESAYECRLLLPNRYQVRTASGINTLDGDLFWHSLTPEAVAAGAVASGTAAEESRARRGATHGFLLQMMTFLLRTPRGVNVSVAGIDSVQGDGLNGNAVVVTDHDGIKVTFVLDRSDGRLLGYAADGTVVRIGSDAPSTAARAVTRVIDYRRYGGILFPARLEMRTRLGANGEEIVVLTIVQKIDVDSLSEADFKRGPGTTEPWPRTIR